MGKTFDKLTDSYNGLPWWVRLGVESSLLFLAIDFVHTFAFHGGAKADMWHMKRHTHDNNGVAEVPGVISDLQNRMRNR